MEQHLCSNDACGKPAVSCCSKCQNQYYCSKICQKQHWKTHKTVCSSLISIEDSPDEVQIVADVDLDYIKLHSSDTVGIQAIGRAVSCIRNIEANNLRDLMLDGTTVTSMVERWQGNDIDVLEYSQLQLGDIVPLKKCSSHAKAVTLQFRETPLLEPIALRNGMVVVDIGFVDFGIALDGAESIESDASNPVTVYGYDKSPFCVAKSIIMIEMMRSDLTTPRSIVEVWMSTLWTGDTFISFAEAINRTMKQISSGSLVILSEVAAILRLWKKSTNKLIPRHEAIKFWFIRHHQQLTPMCMDSCNIVQGRDRAEFMRYELIGALYEDSSTNIGSVVMCLENEGLGIKQQSYLSCTHAAPTSIHYRNDVKSVTAIETNAIPRSSSEGSVKQFVSCQNSSYSQEYPDASNTKTGELSFLDKYRNYFEEKVASIGKKIRDGSLIFLPKLAAVTDNVNDEIAQDIQSKQADVIVWSNVCDEMEPASFHNLARNLSRSVFYGEESKTATTHYVHSSHWHKSVYGTNIHDIPVPSRLELYMEGKSNAELSQANMSLAKKAISTYQTFCSIPLCRKYAANYKDYFFKDQSDVNFLSRADRGDLSVGDDSPLEEYHLPEYNPFLKNKQTLHFSYRYQLKEE